MVSIVLASHGDLAEGLKMTGSMVFGDQPNVATVSLMPSMGPDDFRQKVEEAVASFDDPEDVLFLVDLWGGTPFNQISGLFDAHPSWAILTGVNLPMLVEVYTARFDASKTAHDIAKHVISEARAGVRVKPESLEPVEAKPAAVAAPAAHQVPSRGHGPRRRPHQVRARPCRYPSAPRSGGNHVDQDDQPRSHHRRVRRRLSR